MKHEKFDSAYDQIDQVFKTTKEHQFINPEHKKRLAEEIYARFEINDAVNDDENYDDNQGIFPFTFKYVLSMGTACIILVAVLMASYFFFKNRTPDNTEQPMITEHDRGKEDVVTADDTIGIEEVTLVETGMGERTQYRLGTASHVILAENTAFRIITAKLNGTDEVHELHLTRGSIECSVVLATPGSVFKIHTDLADFTVKGTQFTVAYDRDTNVILTVTEGVVEVDNLFQGFNPVTLNERHSFNPTVFEALTTITGKKVTAMQNDSLTIKRIESKRFITELHQAVRIFGKNNDTSVTAGIIDDLKKNSEMMFEKTGRQSDSDAITEKPVIKREDKSSSSPDRKLIIHTRSGNTFIGREKKSFDDRIIVLETSIGTVKINKDHILSLEIED